jgi:hypothetical protein
MSVRRRILQRNPILSFAAIFVLFTPFIVYAQDADRISLVANVTTPDLRRIKNLGPNRMRLTVNRKPVLIEAVRDEGPRRIVLLLDISESMSSVQSCWDLANQVARDFVREVPNDCSLGLILFGGNIVSEIEIGNDRVKIVAVLDSIRHQLPDKKLTRTTALFDALARADHLLKPSKPGDAIYIVTDGLDSESESNLDKLQSSLQQRQIRLFTFLFGNRNRYQSNFAPVISNAAPFLSTARLRQLSINTGGIPFIFNPGNAKLRQRDADICLLNSQELVLFSNTTEAINNLIFNFYRLDLDFSNAKGGERISIKVVDQNGQNSNIAKVFHSPRFAK